MRPVADAEAQGPLPQSVRRSPAVVDQRFRGRIVPHPAPGTGLDQVHSQIRGEGDRPAHPVEAAQVDGPVAVHVDGLVFLLAAAVVLEQRGHIVRVGLFLQLSPGIVVAPAEGPVGVTHLVGAAGDVGEVGADL